MLCKKYFLSYYFLRDISGGIPLETEIAAGYKDDMGGAG